MSASPSSGTTPVSGPDAKIENGSEDSIKFFATAQKINPQAAVMARFRFEAQSEGVVERLLGVALLYVVFIGLPLAAGIWAIWKIAHGGYR
jgi:hypothetical protein